MRPSGADSHSTEVPSKRRAYRADDQNNAIPDQLMVAIDLRDICFA
jgi:hypothetical protein